VKGERNGIIDRYLLRELLGPFFLGLSAITLVLFIQKMFRLAELVISKGVTLAATLKLFLLILPGFLVITIPMSTLLASVVAFSRLSGDSEITALKASCVSLYRMLRPVVRLSIVSCIVTAFISLLVLPSTNRILREHMFYMVKSSALVAVEPGTFTNKFNGLIIYVDKTTPEGGLEGIFLSDERAPSTPYSITAHSGRLIADPETLDVVLAMQDGSIHTAISEDGPYNRTTFRNGRMFMDINNIFLPAGQLSAGSKDVGTLALMRSIKRTRMEGKPTTSMENELQTRLSIPFACLIFGLAGAPLGIRRTRTGRSSGIVISIVVFLCYYIILGSSKSMAEAGTLSPTVAFWAPNLIIALAAAIFIYLKGEEMHLGLIDRALAWYYRTKRAFK